MRRREKQTKRTWGEETSLRGDMEKDKDKKKEVTFQS